MAVRGGGGGGAIRRRQPGWAMDEREPHSMEEREREREGDRKFFGCPGLLRGNPVAPIAKSYYKLPNF